jgi:pimeloyl-ACP methyl ester carboxylesterase
LHGSGQFGKRIAYMSDSYARIPAAGEPLIIVNPISPGDFQSYDGASWDPVLLDDFLHQLTGFLRVDEQRIYLEGASGGGKGAWEWAFHSPGHFAAMIVLVGGEGYPFRAEKLRNMPIMILNGELDRASYPFLPELMVHALQRVGNDPVYVNYPDRGHSLTGKYRPEELKDWLLGQEGRATPGPDPLDRWQLDTNGISEMGLIEVPDMTVFGLTERENPAYPQDNLYRAAAKLYRAYRVTNGPVAERMADGVAFIHRTKNGGERMLLEAPPLEDLGTNGDLCLVETGPMKAARFYTVTEDEWPELQKKKKSMYGKIASAGHRATGEEHSRLLTIMDADKRYWEVYLGVK